MTHSTPNTQHPCIQYSRKKQQGAVLMISLLLLLVLTVLGVSNMNSSIMEEKMAANAQIVTTLFQAEESAIRTAFYEENQAPAQAVKRARSNQSIDRSAHNVTSESRLAYVGSTPLYNSSAGTFSSIGIEIIGTASQGNIEDSNAQGYSIAPMRN